MGSERKVFSEQEVTAVVRRAVELQEQAGKESYTPGVTSDELERIAGELGIDGKYLQQAIEEAANSPESKRGPLHLTEEFERVVDTELSPDDYDILLKYLKPQNNRGGFTQVGRTLTGTTWTGASVASFTITSKGGRTRVNLKSNALFAWLVSLHPASIGTFVLLPVLASKGFVWLALAISFVLMMAGILGFTTLLKKGHKAARELTNKLAAEIAEAGQTASLPQQTVQQAVEPEPQQVRLNS